MPSPAGFCRSIGRWRAVWGEALAESDKHVDDAGFAATARVHDLVLVTRNTRDVATRKVSILNPFKSPPQRLS